jgi:hypothetical protein
MNFFFRRYEFCFTKGLGVGLMGNGFLGGRLGAG